MHMKHLSIKYNIEDPLTCLRRDPPEKSQYKEYINTKISAYYESELRLSAKTNSKMTYLNISVAGLRGRPHPALSGQLTSKDVKNSRIHLKCWLVIIWLTVLEPVSQGGPPTADVVPQNLPKMKICYIFWQFVTHTQT